jgi:hypothetical protein
MKIRVGTVCLVFSCYLFTKLLGVQCKVDAFWNSVFYK